MWPFLLLTWKETLAQFVCVLANVLSKKWHELHYINHRWFRTRILWKPYQTFPISAIYYLVTLKFLRRITPENKNKQHLQRGNCIIIKSTTKTFAVPRKQTKNKNWESREVSCAKHASNLRQVFGQRLYKPGQRILNHESNYFFVLTQQRQTAVGLRNTSYVHKKN